MITYQLVKRWLDTFISASLLLLASPLLLLIALAIKLDTPGPIIFRQQRIGKKGNPFICWKFRSMYDGADTSWHHLHMKRLILENSSLDSTSNGESLKLKNDPRITRVGKFLRISSLDELPQLINVLRGEMSLVGPRPPISYEVELYQAHHQRRLDVTPGITGLWQVKGRNQVSFEEMVQMDIQYIETMNFWLDLSIIFSTPMAMIKGKGAG